MMKTRVFAIAVLAALFAAAQTEAGWRYGAPADALAVPPAARAEVRTEPPARAAPVAGGMPRSGIPQSRVLREIGEPESRMPPVGKPPIGRWLYPAFIVYFERDRVITSVSR